MTPSDDGRDDDVLARLDAGIEPATEDEAKARAPYERLMGRIRSLEPVEPRPGWDDRLETRWRAARAAARRRRAYLVAGAGVVTVAAAIILLLALRGTGAQTPALQVAIVAGDGSPRRSRSAVGDTLQVRARATRPHTELRVYIDTRLVTRCPGNPACRLDAGVIQLEISLEAAGTYRVVAMSHTAAIPPPGDGGLDEDLLTARRAGVTLEPSERRVVAP